MCASNTIVCISLSLYVFLKTYLLVKTKPEYQIDIAIEGDLKMKVVFDLEWCSNLTLFDVL